MLTEHATTGWKPETEAEKDAVFEQLDRLLHDPAFAKSKRYPSLLKFVVQRTLDGEEDSLKERILGIEIFERRPDYDTTEDPIVRVTAAKIRKRISEYYGNPLHHDELRIDLPAGSYIPVFQRGMLQEPPAEPEPYPVRSTLIQPLHEDPVPDIAVATHQTPTNTGRKPFVIAAIAILLVGAMIWAVASWKTDRSNPLTSFWRPLVGAQVPVLVCIADEPRGTIALMDASNPVPQVVAGNIPSIVDVENIFPVTDLTSMIASHGQRYSVQGQRRTTISDLSHAPTVLMGAYNNIWTLRLTHNLRFHFANEAATHSYWIEDAQAPGQRKWLRDLKMQSTETGKDYAIVARFTPVETGQPTVVIAGLGHAANIAAVEFVLSGELLKQLDQQSAGDWRRKNVEAIIETPVINAHAGAPGITAMHVW